MDSNGSERKLQGNEDEKTISIEIVDAVVRVSRL